MSSVKSEARENISRPPTLSRNVICINNEENIHSSNTLSKSSNTEFLNSTQRERNSTADLKSRFQVDAFTIPANNGNARFIDKSVKDFEKRLLSKAGNNFEELSRMGKCFPSTSRNSARVQEYQKSKEDEDFEKSLPLTGDPDIDEEIIAFYKAKRAGGTY